MKEMMFKYYKLFFLVLVSCSVSVFGMYDNSLRNRITQTDYLPAAIRQTGAVETVIRDALCGGLIAHSVIATIMVATVANHHDGPCRRYVTEGIISHRCFWQGFIGLSCIGFALWLKGLGFLFDVANNYPTERAIVWRDRCRVLYGIATVCAMLYSDYLFEKLV